jgi:predicted house-cleaning noncanonical NTP pyrophosphatase (MazG superfamily)
MTYHTQYRTYRAFRGGAEGAEMTKVQHQRLIRDNAPNKMREAGVAFETRQLDELEFKSALLKKVVEEAGGLAASETKADILGELADLLAVLDQVQRTFTITDAELRKARSANANEKGGFRERFFLEWSEGGDYTRSV